MASVSGRYGVSLASYGLNLRKVCISLGSFWEEFGIILMFFLSMLVSCRDHFWDQSGIIVGTIFHDLFVDQPINQKLTTLYLASGENAFDDITLDRASNVFKHNLATSHLRGYRTTPKTSTN